MTRTVAVTGATGFLGRLIVSDLLGRGARVRALVRDPATAAKRLLPGDAERVELVVCDLVRPIEPSALADTDSLIHAAAHIPTDMADPGEAQRCLMVNATGTLRLLQAAGAAGVNHVVHLSSGNVYRDQGRPAGEDDPLYPAIRAPYYLSSKICGEIYANHLAQSGATGITVLRPSAIYGPGMAPGGLVAQFVSRALSGRDMVVADGGRYSVDLVHVADVARAASLCATRRVTGTFNIGSGRATTVLELAQHLQRLLLLPDDRIRIEGDPLGGPTSGYAVLDITRAKSAFDYHPRSVADGLATMIGPPPQPTQRSHR